MSVDIRLPFAEFLFACLAEYAKQNNLPKLSPKIWMEETKRAHDAWHLARKVKKAKAAAFVPPTPEEVTAYSIEIGWPLDGIAWCLGYEKKGWKIGSSKMVSWKHAVQHWKREQIHTKHTPSMPTTHVPQEGPTGWLGWARENVPGWTRFLEETQGHAIPPWDKLQKSERDAISQQMKGAK